MFGTYLPFGLSASLAMLAFYIAAITTLSNLGLLPWGRNLAHCSANSRAHSKKFGELCTVSCLCTATSDALTLARRC